MFFMPGSDVMPHVEPFRAILYNYKKVDISNVVAPPYDVISPQMQDELYRADEYNIVRLILGKEEPADSKIINKYTRARDFFNNWLKDKVLIQDRAAGIYVYSQEYFYENRRKVRLGFIARMKIEDPRTSRVLPHEYTFAKPKQDRLNLIREVKANLSPIFTLFQDEDNNINPVLKACLKKRPIFDTEQDGVRHRAWRLTDKKLIKKIQKFMLDKDIYIADGHHRYEVAALYRDEMRSHSPQTNKGYDYVMMYFSPLDEKALTILSTHRIVKKIYMDMEVFLKKLIAYFYVKKLKSIKQLFGEMGSVRKNEYAFGVYFKDRSAYFLKLKNEKILDEIIKENKSKEWKRLDVSILHGLIFDHILHLREKIQDEDNIIYTRDPDFAKEELDKGKYEAAFFLNPTKVNQVRDIARTGDRMPHKSTYFYPKLLSGLVINKVS